MFDHRSSPCCIRCPPPATTTARGLLLENRITIEAAMIHKKNAPATKLKYCFSSTPNAAEATLRHNGNVIIVAVVAPMNTTMVRDRSLRNREGIRLQTRGNDQRPAITSPIVGGEKRVALELNLP